MSEDFILRDLNGSERFRFVTTLESLLIKVITPSHGQPFTFVVDIIEAKQLLAWLQEGLER